MNYNKWRARLENEIRALKKDRNFMKMIDLETKQLKNRKELIDYAKNAFAMSMMDEARK